MRRLYFLLTCCLLLSPAAHAAEGHILKVLPQFLDKKGRASLTPSLYDRDAYQAILRKTPEKRSALRYAIQWKADTKETEALTLRVELIGAAQDEKPKQTSIETTVHQRHWFSHWANLTLTEEQYKSFGDVTAWRVTLWNGNKLLGEQKSFLWQ